MSTWKVKGQRPLRACSSPSRRNYRTVLVCCRKSSHEFLGCDVGIQSLGTCDSCHNKQPTASTFMQCTSSILETTHKRRWIIDYWVGRTMTFWRQTLNALFYLLLSTFAVSYSMFAFFFRRNAQSPFSDSTNETQILKNLTVKWNANQALLSIFHFRQSIPPEVWGIDDLSLIYEALLSFISTP